MKPCGYCQVPCNVYNTITLHSNHTKYNIELGHCHYDLMSSEKTLYIIPKGSESLDKVSAKSNPLKPQDGSVTVSQSPVTMSPHLSPGLSPPHRQGQDHGSAGGGLQHCPPTSEPSFELEAPVSTIEARPLLNKSISRTEAVRVQAGSARPNGTVLKRSITFCSMQ